MNTKNNTSFLVLFIVISFALAIQGCTPASCGVSEYVVTKFNDTNDGACTPDDCSLREAVINANTCSGHQTIQLPAGGYVLTIAGIDEDAAATGDLDITDDLTVQGVGAPSINAGGIDRVFEVFAPAVVQMDLLIIIGGEAQLGGGIRNHSQLRLRDSSVHGNLAVVPPAGSGTSGGGGLFNQAGTMTLENTQVFDNSADHGGGIHNFATANLVVNGGIISFNDASQNAGGLWVNAASTANLDGVIIEGNAATISGGGVYNAGTTTLQQVDIIANVSDGLPGGGGIYNVSPMDPVLGDAVITIEDSLIAENDGGGILNFGVVNIFASMIRDNVSTGSLHPGIENADEMSIDRSVISGNQVNGLINGPAGVLTVTDTTIKDNTGGNGAGVISAGTTSIERSTISGNIAASSGGGIEIQGGNLELVNVTVSGNQAGGVGGGILLLTSPSDPLAFGHLLMHDSTVTLNQPEGLMDTYGGTTIERSIVAENINADCVGGGMTSAGHNLDSDGTCGFGAAGDLSSVAPALGPLADNGGLTHTHALLPASPALDAAGGTCAATDQRGVGRPQGVACDMGAYEAEGEAPTPVPSPTPPPTAAMDTPTPVPEASINFNADSYAIKEGECTILRWQVENATSAFLEGEDVDMLGARQVCPAKATTYSMLVLAPSGDLEAKVTIEVELLEPPPAPVQFGYQEICNQKKYGVELQWVDVAKNEKGYRVYREGVLVATLPRNATSYSDTPPSFGSFTYGVEAFNAAGASSRPSLTTRGCGR